MTHPHAGNDGHHADGQPGAVIWGDSDRAALVALMRLKPKSGDWSKLTEQVIECGSAFELWSADHPESLFGSDPDAALMATARRDVDEWKHMPFDFHTFRDSSYPDQLRSVRQMPPVVFTHGKLIHNEVGISVVGSRKASQSGLEFARDVAYALVEHDVSVIAGLAAGIDTAAHCAALEAGGRTVAVLGNGLDYVYPRSNQELQAEVASRGMLLTHFLPEYAPTRWSFLARNVTMSAYGAATVVVEAGEHSGTRTQAREAVAHGRPVILNSTVMQTTDWARRLTEEPGVYVASTPSEVIGHVGTILAHRRTVESWLSASE
ncbi:DNA-processing protein DprA [Nocardia sp. NPDC049220]|uniref:DNA-processing protein DprA n=1 Tax=Nocardia sp. NPDC049220 TaxID=3155273 RepID=UPI0034045790